MAPARTQILGADLTQGVKWGRYMQKNLGARECAHRFCRNFCYYVNALKTPAAPFWPPLVGRGHRRAANPAQPPFQYAHELPPGGQQGGHMCGRRCTHQTSPSAFCPLLSALFCVPWLLSPPKFWVLNRARGSSGGDICKKIWVQAGEATVFTATHTTMRMLKKRPRPIFSPLQLGLQHHAGQPGAVGLPVCL